MRKTDVHSDLFKTFEISDCFSSAYQTLLSIQIKWDIVYFNSVNIIPYWGFYYENDDTRIK